VNLSLGRRTKLALGTLVVAVIALLFIRVVVKWELIGQVGPPMVPPSGSVETTVVGNLTFEASASFRQDFMPIIGPQGPPFWFTIRVTVNNSGPEIASGFNITKATVYFGGTILALQSFDIHLVQPEEYLVPSGEIETFLMTNSREIVYSPTLTEGTMLYARVLVTLSNGNWIVLTSPPAPLGFTW
jgi:hypothetical protein